MVAWLSMVPIALKAAEKLSAEDIEVEVIDIRSLYPHTPPPSSSVLEKAFFT